MDIPTENIRLLIYLSLVLLGSVSASSLWVARDKVIPWDGHIPYPWLTILFWAGLLSFFALLAVSIRDLHWLKRSNLIWPIILTSGGCSAAGWTWWILVARSTFTVEWWGRPSLH